MYRLAKQSFHFGKQFSFLATDYNYDIINNSLIAITILHRTSLYQNVLQVFFYAIVPGNDVILKALSK